METKDPFGDLEAHLTEIVLREQARLPPVYPELFGDYEPPSRWQRIRRWPGARVYYFRSWLGEKILPYEPMD